MRYHLVTNILVSMKNNLINYRASRVVFFSIALILLCINSFTLIAEVPARPQPPRLVNDLALIFTPTERANLEQAVVAFADSTSNQIAIITVPELYGMDKAQLAYSIGEQWGVGQSKFDNGVVILIKPKQQNSNGEVFIAAGYGLEGVLTDALARQIIETKIIPYFKSDNYYGGVISALNVLFPLLSGEISTSEFAKSSTEGGLNIGVIIFLTFMLIFVLVLFKSNNDGPKNIGGGRRGGKDFDALDALFLGSILSSGSRRGGSGFGGGSFGGGSFGGGSFGGFGGGSFGGGGAGGSW